MKKIWLYVAISALVLAAGGILLLTQSGCSGSMEIGQGPTMLYFYAKWWEVCQRMEPIVDGLEKQYGREFKIIRVDIDTAQGKQLAREHGFIGQPTFILFNNGEEVKRLQGEQTAERLQQVIEQTLGKW